jgi:hypothetical protein
MGKPAWTKRDETSSEFMAVKKSCKKIQGNPPREKVIKSDGPERRSGPSLDTSDRAGEEQPEAGIKFCGRSFVPIIRGCRAVLFVATPRDNRNASSGNGRCNAFASSHGARIQTSHSSSVVRITGIALGWNGSTIAFGAVVRKP